MVCMEHCGLSTPVMRALSLKDRFSWAKDKVVVEKKVM